MLEIDEVGVKTFYTYDAAGHILSVTLDHEGPEAVRFDYDYDEDFSNRVTSITPRNPADDSVNPHWQAWRYDYWLSAGSSGLIGGVGRWSGACSRGWPRMLLAKG